MKKIKLFLLFFLFIGLSFGGLAFVSNSIKKQNDIKPNYVLGDLSEKTGEFKESKTSIVTDGFIYFEVIELYSDYFKTISYQVFFYDDKKEYINCTEPTTDRNVFSTITEDYSCCKIVIFPNYFEESSEEKEIKWNEILDLADNLSIYSLTSIDIGLSTLDITVHNSSELITIYYEEGMTWEQWCSSDYNKYGFGSFFHSDFNCNLLASLNDNGLMYSLYSGYTPDPETFVPGDDVYLILFDSIIDPSYEYILAKGTI